MKMGFVTCVELGLTCMRAIHDAGGRFEFAITIPDSKAPTKAGRVYIDRFCSERGITLFKTENINDDECIVFLKNQKPDWLFIIGWSQIAGPAVLAAAGHVIGAHPTLLPEGRGRAAIPWAIIKGLQETGVTFFLMDAGVDSGDIIAQTRVPLDARETASTLYKRIAHAHATLIQDVWRSISSHTLRAIPQDHSRATTWPRRTPADGELKPTMTVVEVDRLVRASTTPYPGAFARLPDGSILRVWSGRAARSSVAPAGSRRLTFCDGAFDAEVWAIEENSNSSQSRAGRPPGNDP